MADGTRLDGVFTHSETLKTIQATMNNVLWAEAPGTFRSLIKHVKFNWGGPIEDFYSVDPGGLAMGGISLNGGKFVRGDKTSHAKGTIIPSFQTATIEYERLLDDLTSGDSKAYVNTKAEEYKSKAMLMKSYLYQQTLGDGTGRWCEPIGIGPDNVSSGASATVVRDAYYTPVLDPLKIKISDLSVSVGSIAHLVEGFAFSFWYADYDENNDGVYEGTTTTCVPRIMALGFKGSATGTEVVYDAFRIVDVDVEAGYIYVLPGRIATKGATTVTHATQTFVTNDGSESNEVRWCPGDLTENVIITPYQGITAGVGTELLPTGAVTIANGFDAVFNPTAKTLATYIMHPYYMPASYTQARLCLGLNWSASTDIGRLNPFIPCGIEGLLMNTSNTIHGISRSRIRQALPTIMNAEGQPMNFELFRRIITKHATRNPLFQDSEVGKKSEGGDIAKVGSHWQHISVNPVVYNSLISSVEFNTLFNDGKGSFGEEGAKVMTYGGRRYQIVSTNEMSLRRLWIIPKGALEYFDGTIKDVSNDGGQSKFLKTDPADGQRMNVVQEYKLIKSAMRLMQPRSCGGAFNFSY
jgi:hypothetical protein